MEELRGYKTPKLFYNKWISWNSTHQETNPSKELRNEKAVEWLVRSLNPLKFEPHLTGGIINREQKKILQILI